MDNNETIKTIYLEASDDVVSVIEKIQNEISGQVNLVIPKRSTLTRSIINFKILKDEAALLKKKIFITTGDKLGQNLAVKAGLDVQTISESGDLIQEIKNEDDIKNPQTYNISDLRNIPSQEEILEIRNEVKENNIKPEELPAPASIGHVQVSDIIRKSHTVQSEPEKSAEKNIKDFILEETRKNELNEFKKESIVNDARSVNDYNAMQDNRKNISMVSSWTKKIFLVFAALSLIVALVVVFIVLPKAKVSIVSKVDSLGADIDFIVDPNIAAVDIATQKLPGKIIALTGKEKVQEFAATEKKKISEKARGSITVYNEWSTNPQVLIENTRFASKGGKVFRTKKTIVIPGMERVDGKDMPGVVDTEVEAQEAGESYNIEPDSFTIPGFIGTVKYSSIYGRSKTRMTGGLIGEALTVSSADISSARDAMIKDMESGAAELVKKDVPVNFKVIDEAIQTKIDKVEPDAKEGDVKDKFTVKITASSTALVFNEKDLNALVGEIIKNKPELINKIIIPDRNEAITYGKPSFDKDGKMMLSLHVEKKFAWKINADDVKNKIKGRNKTELNDIFSKIDGIDSAETQFEPKWAFWINSVPNNDSRISISIE